MRVYSISKRQNLKCAEISKCWKLFLSKQSLQGNTRYEITVFVFEACLSIEGLQTAE